MSKSDRKPHPLRKSGKADEHKRQLQLMAEARQLAYDALTTEEKIAKLDAGGFRAVRQRARLSS
jgi:hypothetical protein